MIAVEAFDPAHLDALEVQPSQAGEALPGEVYAAAGPAWTAFDRNGRAIFAGGVMPINPGYGLAWSLLATGKGAAMVALTKAIRRRFAELGWRRIEAWVDADDVRAGDWMIRLGFELESIKRAAAPDGGDIAVWVTFGREGSRGA